MGFDATLRAGLKTLDKVTKSLQTTVTWFPWVGQDGFGEQLLASGIAVRAILEPQHAAQRGEVGDLVIKAKILILAPLPATATYAAATIALADVPGRQPEAVDLRDVFILADGTTGPIVGNPGLTDPTTARTYFAEVSIGEAPR